MLNIINKLSVFFEDCYREISVREYAREVGVSPPTASKLLNSYVSEGLLTRREDRGFLLFSVDRESDVARNLSRIYWKDKLGGLLEFLESELNFGAVVLFGSLSRIEVSGSSDIDLVVFRGSKKNIDLKKFEKKLGREIQLFRFNSLNDVNEELRLNIINGFVLGGYLE